MVEALWGKNARVSKVVPTQGRRRRGQKPEEVSAYTLNANKSYAIRHICYHASMLSKGIVGILDVDKKIDMMPVTNPQERVGECNLGDVLYKLKLSDGSSLVGEVHQAAVMSPVDVVVGNTEEERKLIEMMNKNVAAFLYNIIRGWNMDEHFTEKLLRATVDPELVDDMDSCHWDVKTNTLRTPKDEENEKQKGIEESAWYNSDYVSQLTKTTKKKKKFVAQEKVFQLDDEHSFKTLNEKSGTYEGSPGATTFQVGGEGKTEAVECNRDKEEEVSLMSATSGVSNRQKNSAPTKEELLEMMKKANISIDDLKEGSAPILHGKSCGKIIDEVFSESSDSDSTSSSGTSESVDSVVRHDTGSVYQASATPWRMEGCEGGTAIAK